jgi:WhiB family redox-sensing transcriptional regulator
MTAIDDVPDWRSRGACLTADPELFFPISSTGTSQEQEEQAREVCARCLVRDECLAFALRTNQAHGVWGGLGEAERLRLRRRLRAAGSIPVRSPGTGRVAGRRRRVQPEGTQPRYRVAG